MPPGASTRANSAIMGGWSAGVEVLDRLEGHDGVDAGVGQRQRSRGAFDEPQVRQRDHRIARMRDRRRIHVDAHDACRARRQQRAAVALAAGDVSDPATGDEVARERIAMPMLLRNLALDAGHEALTGEFERVGRHGAGTSQ